ncbi:MAG: DUF3078 domain-containing protein [Bacteroidales bacterium]
MSILINELPLLAQNGNDDTTSTSSSARSEPIDSLLNNNLENDTTQQVIVDTTVTKTKHETALSEKDTVPSDTLNLETGINALDTTNVQSTEPSKRADTKKDSVITQKTDNQLKKDTTVTADKFIENSTHKESKQNSIEQRVEASPEKPLELTPSAASKYLAALVERESLWRRSKDTLRLSLSRLINHYHEPYDSISKRLETFPIDSIQVKPTRFTDNDTISIKWLTSNEFIINDVTLDRIPVIKLKTIVMRAIDSLSLSSIDTLPEVRSQLESYLQVRDTITETFVDTEYLESKNIQLYKTTDEGITPPIQYQGRSITDGFSADSSEIIVPKTRAGLIANDESPFYEVASNIMPDSLKHAIETLISYAEERDSILINIKNIEGQKTPIWLTTGRDDLFRYWVKNSNNDSITVWIGNPSKLNISLILEEEVSLKRMEKKVFDDVPFTKAKPKLTLAEVEALKEIPVYWDNELSSSYSLNQNHLSNWARGGESSVISMIDFNAKAEYNNKEDKTKWTNTGRLKYGTTWTNDDGFRTNTDVIEANSQYNSAIREKLDFSSGVYFRTQAAKGYNYPNDSVVISQFLNPGTFTISSGIEFKPNSNTSINFSPLSYKNTFVLDTAKINQTAHGIEKDKKARQEMGGQLVVKNTATFFEDMKIENTLRLFSNYLEKPQNVDVDWEMSIEKQISWYFKIRLNFHLIYDDNIQFPVLDANEEPVLLPDGSEKKVPRVQINQLLGLTLMFKI